MEHNDRILGAVEGWKAQVATEDAKAEKKKAKLSMGTRVYSKSDIKDINTLRSYASTFVHSPSPSPSSSYPIQVPCASRPLALMTINTIVDSQKTPGTPKRLDGMDEESVSVQSSSKKTRKRGPVSDESRYSLSLTPGESRNQARPKGRSIR